MGLMEFTKHLRSAAAALCLTLFLPLSGVPGAPPPSAGAALSSAAPSSPSLSWASALAAQEPSPERPHLQPAPDRRPDEGEGPYRRLVLSGVVLVDGSGAPPRGPVDIVIEGNRIASIRSVGDPSVRAEAADAGPDGRVIDGRGLWVLPGFVDLHGHIHAAREGMPAEYVFKLWMAHGVTSVRDPGSGDGIDYVLRERERSARNEIVAPRIFAYAGVGLGWDRPVDTPEAAREWVRDMAARGMDGVKLRDVYDPAVARAVFEEAREVGLGSAAHLTQLGVARMNALYAARAGLTTLEHWYGLPEALFADRTVQRFPREYNYSDEYHRFAEAGRLWRQAAAPGSDRYEAVTRELLELGLVLDPTLTIYEANRDVMRARRAEWHERYTLPSLWAFFQPSREAHGSYWFRWTTADEIAWKENFRIWMDYLADYHARGGRICTGSDSGYIYKVYGFAYIRELELLQEAGLHPLEVVRAATLCGAEALARPTGRPPEFGTVEPGRLADLVVVEANPIEDFKVLYGTGAVRLDDETGQVRRMGGVKWTVKDGILYDAPRMLEDVARLVEEARAAEEAASAEDPTVP